MIKTEAELATAQVPFWTTALKYVEAVNAPIERAGSVVAVFAISVGVKKVELGDFCHFTTDPVFPDKDKAFGVIPEQIV